MDVQLEAAVYQDSQHAGRCWQTMLPMLALWLPSRHFGYHGSLVGRVNKKLHNRGR